MVIDLLQYNKVNTEKVEKQWNAIFPPEQKTEEDCLLFISRMSYIAFAEYLLQREIVSPKVFKRRRIGDIVFHTFNKELRWGSKLSDMMRGIGEAVRMKYARQAFVMINEDEDDHDLATEVFTVSFAYNEEDCLKIADENGNNIVSMGYKGKDVLRKQVGYLIQKITAVSANLKKFNGNVTPFIKITYYDERTPMDYQPFAFQHCDTTYIFKNVPPRHEFGSVSTNLCASAIDIQSVYIDDPATLEEVTLHNLKQYETGFLDETVEGDVTMIDQSHFEVMEQENEELFDSLEIARKEYESEHVTQEQDKNQTYDIPTTNAAPILQEDLRSSPEPSVDTTNEDCISSELNSSLAKKGVVGKRKNSQKSKKSPIKKSPLKLRTTRNKRAKETLSKDDVQNDTYIMPFLQSKVSKAYTSPNRHVSPQRSAGRQFFKSSIVIRSVDKSPEDASS